MLTEPPADPLPLVLEWLGAAARSQLRNPHAMALATATPDGKPSVRMVLLKRLAVPEGFALFYTNYGSRKARELEANERGAAVLYWEQLGRQIRFEGRLRRSPDGESDSYFATRPRASQINAWASRQSAELASWGELERAIDARAAELEGAPAVPRPPFWGGYRLWLDSVELWLEGTDRYHERVRYERTLRPTAADAFAAGQWRHALLQP
jgi:pyridoxamine 5'-phosphate oxidase